MDEMTIIGPYAPVFAGRRHGRIKDQHLHWSVARGRGTLDIAILVCFYLQDMSCEERVPFWSCIL